MSKFSFNKWMPMIVSLLLFFLIFASTTTGQTSEGKNKFPKILLISPKPNDVLTPGQKVTINWGVDLPQRLDMRYCEQEIYLSIDGGKTRAVRLTNRLSGLARAFIWTVPNLPTDQAVLVFHFGSEGGGVFFERTYVKRSAVFRIRQAESGVESIELVPMTINASNGDEVKLSWHSSITNVDFFEVFASVDRGAHFAPIGKSLEQDFSWTVPAGFSGGVFFKVVAHKLKGEQIESLTNPEPMVLVEQR